MHGGGLFPHEFLFLYSLDRRYKVYREIHGIGGWRYLAQETWDGEAPGEVGDVHVVLISGCTDTSTRRVVEAHFDRVRCICYSDHTKTELRVSNVGQVSNDFHRKCTVDLAEEAHLSQTT